LGKKKKKAHASRTILFPSSILLAWRSEEERGRRGAREGGERVGKKRGKGEGPAPVWF